MSLKEIMNYRKTTTFSQNAKFTKPPKKIKLGAFKNPRNFFKNSKKLKIKHLHQCSLLVMLHFHDFP